MKDGNWIPLDKALIKTLPKNRSYSYIEAMFSYTVDQDNGKDGSINGYASLWGWSRNKVRKFIQELRTGKGHIADRKGTGRGHPIRFINSNLQTVGDRKGTGRGQEEDRKRDTTIYPKPKPDPKPKKQIADFSIFYEAYPKKKNKGQAEKTWIKLSPTNDLLKEMLAGIERAKKSKEWLKDNGDYIPHPSTWLNAKGWEDEAIEPKDYEVIIDGVSKFITASEYEEWKADNGR